MSLSTEVMQTLAARRDAIRSINPESIIPRDGRHTLTIKDLKAGGVFRLRNKTYRVIEVGRYDEFDEDFKKKKKFSAYELKLFCLEDGSTVNIEWEEDDEVEISLTTKKLSFRDLSDEEGVGVDDDDLDQISEEEDSVFLAGTEFEYDDDWAAKYYRTGGTKDGLKVYFYDFKDAAGRCLTVEEWVDDSGSKKTYDYEIYVSEAVRPGEMEIVVTG